MQKLTLLVIEDQTAIAKNIADFFSSKGHTLDFAYTGKQGLTLALNNFYDIILLDLTLPEMDGWEVCKVIREKAERHIPIIMLTARDTLDDKIQGFQLGADDYLTKPYALQELEMRCHALSRRNILHTHHVISLGELTIDRAKKQVERSGNLIHLQHIPYIILLALAEAHPRVVAKNELVSKIWGDEPTESDALRSHIYQLRQALDKPFDSPLLVTVHGLGFSLDIQQ